MERERCGRHDFAYQRPSVEGREKCRNRIRSSYKGETLVNDLWKAFDLAFPPLSLSLSPYLRDVSRCQGACMHRRERTDGRPSYLLLLQQLVSSVDPKSTPAEIYERVEIKIEKYAAWSKRVYSLSLSAFILVSRARRIIIYI